MMAKSKFEYTRKFEEEQRLLAVLVPAREPRGPGNTSGAGANALTPAKWPNRKNCSCSAIWRMATECSGRELPCSKNYIIEDINFVH